MALPKEGPATGALGAKGSGYGTPSPAQGTTRIKNWLFTSAFETGNALYDSWKSLGDIDGVPTFSVELARDCHGDPKVAKAKAFWFHFGVVPAEANYSGSIKLIVHGMPDLFHLFATGYRPWVLPPSHKRWDRIVTQHVDDVKIERSEITGWCCTWKYRFDGASGMTRFAFCHPYGYQELMEWLDRLEADFKELSELEAVQRRRRRQRAQADAGGGILRCDRLRAERDFLQRYSLIPKDALPEIEHEIQEAASSSTAACVSESEDEWDDDGGPEAMAAGGPSKELYYFKCREWHDEVLHAGSGVYFHRQTIVRTPRGRKVDMLTVTEDLEDVGPDWPREQLPEVVERALRDDKEGKPPGDQPLRFPGRPVCFFSARCHPGETSGQFAFNGVLQFILSDDPRAVELRRRFVFKVVPMLNPDGVAWGHSRTNSLSHDLNRCYRNPTHGQHEGVWAVKAFLVNWAQERNLLFYMDCHGHAARNGCFFFGNHQGGQSWSSEDALLWNVAYAHACQLNCPHIDIDACEWSRQADGEPNKAPTAKGKKSKESEEDGHEEETSRSESGRSQIGFACRLYHAYTLECHYNISRRTRPVPDAPGLPPAAQAWQALRGEIMDGDSRGKRPKPVPYILNDWAAVGEAMAVALLDLHGLNAHSRLIEGGRPPKPLLPPEKELEAASAGLDRLWNALAQRHAAARDLQESGGAVPRCRLNNITPDEEDRPTTWIVSGCEVVFVVPKPDPTQTSKDKLATKTRGDIMDGTEVIVDGVSWLEVMHEGTKAYVLVDGKAAGSNCKFLAPLAEGDFLRRSVFKVMHQPHVYIRGQPKKEGTSLGIRKTGDIMVIQEERSDGWVQLDRTEVNKIARKGCVEAYMLVDGSGMGLGQLLTKSSKVVKVRTPLYCDGGVLPCYSPWVEDVEGGLYPPSDPCSLLSNATRRPTTEGYGPLTLEELAKNPEGHFEMAPPPRV